MRHRVLPELVKGIRIQYTDRDSKTRVETIRSRTGNFNTVINVLKEKTKIDINRVTGYWPPKVKASPKNMIRLEE